MHNYTSVVIFQDMDVHAHVNTYMYLSVNFELMLIYYACVFTGCIFSFLVLRSALRPIL